VRSCGGPLLVTGASVLAFSLGTVPPSLFGATLFVQSVFFDVPPTTVSLGPVSSLVLLDASL